MFKMDKLQKHRRDAETQKLLQQKKQEDEHLWEQLKKTHKEMMDYSSRKEKEQIQKIDHLSEKLNKL